MVGSGEEGLLSVALEADCWLQINGGKKGKQGKLNNLLQLTNNLYT